MESIAAVYKSASILDAARADPRDDSKMSWLLGDLDTLRVPGPFNLVMAGVSILLRSGSAVLRANTTCVLEAG